mmetsp:Transcript_53123/g.128993  ORF Transcript_53123/g.128993 Transcript_53123/m.128993 type:complete len:230 (-) Transcript_53123:447-1136(-)
MSLSFASVFSTLSSAHADNEAKSLGEFVRNAVAHNRRMSIVGMYDSPPGTESECFKSTHSANFPTSSINSSSGLTRFSFLQILGSNAVILALPLSELVKCSIVVRNSYTCVSVISLSFSIAFTNANIPCGIIVDDNIFRTVRNGGKIIPAMIAMRAQQIQMRKFLNTASAFSVPDAFHKSLTVSPPSVMSGTNETTSIPGIAMSNDDTDDSEAYVSPKKNPVNTSVRRL